MRLFIGVELDEAVAAAAERGVALLRGRLERRGLRLEAAWVPRENLHITLWFLGHVPEPEVPALQETLAAPFDTPAFDIRIAGAGAFPPSGPPRVIWFGLLEGAAALRSLHRELADRLPALGFEPEGRDYAAHLTVARVKHAPAGAGRAVRETLRSAAIDLPPCRISAVTLFRSHLSSAGARYEPVLRVALR